MKILVVGASQGTGALTVKEALDRGHDVTAFARTPDRLDLAHPKLTKRRGDFHDAADVDAAVRGHDAVIVTASPSSLSAFRKSPKFFSTGTRFVIDAMKKHGVKKLVILSALGVGDSRPLCPFLVRLLLVDFLLREPFRDHGIQETMAKESGLDWISARPGRLVDRPAQRTYVKTTAIDRVPAEMARADVADFLVDAAEKDTWNGHAVQVGG
jgi:uncharacterized protein YbjT (DUF2867 family)